MHSISYCARHSGIFDRSLAQNVMYHSFLHGHGEDGTILRCDAGRVLDDLAKLHDLVELLLDTYINHCIGLVPTVERHSQSVGEYLLVSILQDGGLNVDY